MPEYEYPTDQYDSFEKFKILIKEKHTGAANSIKALVYSNPNIKDLILKMGLNYEESKQSQYNVGRDMHILTIYYNQDEQKYFIEDKEHSDIELDDDKLMAIYQSMFKYFDTPKKGKLYIEE